MPEIRERTRSLSQEEGAQSLVEFALLLPILMYILMGIIQFGLIFNGYVTMANSIREGARSASFYVYTAALNEAQNDSARLTVLETDMLAARGVLNMGTVPGTGTTNFAHTNTWSGSCAWNAASPCTITDGDISVTWNKPASVTSNMPRRGYQMTVDAYFHEVLFIPLIDLFLPNDPTKGAGWFRVPAHFTVVIN